MIPLSVRTYVARCLWSMIEMFVQHCSFILCSFVVCRAHTVCVCITARLGCPFNSNVWGGDITSFPPPTAKGGTIHAAL